MEQLQTETRDSRTDRLNRRKRHHGRQPKGKTVLTPASDVTGIFEPLQRHGILPSNYLDAFRAALVKHVNRNGLQKRLGNLYHENYGAYGVPALDRPAAQWASPEADYQHISYVLAEGGYRALTKAGTRYEYASQADKGWYDHQHMTGCITGSIELATLKHGTIYGDQEAIFTHEKCPQSTRDMTRPIELVLGERTGFDRRTGRPKTVKHTIIPDQLFRITYPPKNNVKIFALETDCATEDYETVYEKIRRWVTVLKEEIHTKQWGTPSLIVLIVTTNDARMRKFMAFAKQHAGQDAWLLEHLLFKAEPIFSGAWKVPPILYGLYEEPWLRADGSTFDISY